jgi:LuxR family maltose regulon positive regulatory protein
LLQSARPLPLIAALTPLVNDLAALPGSTLLVIDDYHLIDDSAVHAALTLVVERLPPRTHLILSSRCEPPLPLPRLRAHGQLLELRAADLRFTEAEARAVLRLLAAGRSNRTIAAELIVTVGTVKRHVSNLMAKLGAESRLAAVARARELGLIEHR